MEPLDIDALLKKNPHLDEEVVRERHKKASKGPRKKSGVIPAPHSPSRHRPRRREGDEWNTTSPGYRPHYRGI